MRLSKLLLIFTGILGVMLVSLALLVRPLWFDINDFLGTNLPVMPAVIVLGALITGYTIFLFNRGHLDKPRAWRHFLPVIVADVFTLALLYVFFSELGREGVMITRNLMIALPYVLWLGTAGLAFLYPPKNRLARAGIIAILAAAAIGWYSFPGRVALTTRPAVYIQQGGVNVVWETNMRALSWVDYGPDETLGLSAQEQTHGLKVTGDAVQRVFIPRPNLADHLVFQSHVEGLKNIFPISAVKTGQAESEIISVKMPKTEDGLSFVAFSDLHEQRGTYAVLEKQIEWQKMDFVVYAGDLVNSLEDPGQFKRSFLSLTTGGRDLPRVFVRGNHETRGEAARSLDEWILPPGGNYYFTFQSGESFFIVLDTGEDKPDSDIEYSGLVNFTAYQQEQARWLDGVLASRDYQQAKYRIILVHRPPNTPVAEQFAPVLALIKERSDIDLLISGDSHEGGIFTSEETGLPFTIANCGGSEVEDMAAVSVDIADDTIKVAIIGVDGSIWESAEIKK